MRHDTAQDYRRRLERVLRHIQLNLAGPLTPGDLAGLASFSPHHFQRIFRAMVGESIGGHVRRLRLERAAGELRRTDRGVLEIALDCGYGAHEPFTRAFTARFGMSPTAYREAADVPPFPESACNVHYGPDDAVNKFVPIIRENPMQQIEIKSLDPVRLAALGHTGPYNQMGQTFQKLMAWAGPRGLFGPMTRVMGVYYDDPRSTEGADCRAAAAITIAPDFEPASDADVEVIELHGGRHAVAAFKGPYERLDEAYQWLFGTWLCESGEHPADGPVFESYLTNPMTTKPEDSVTEICVPLAEG